MAFDETTKTRIVLLRSHGVSYARIAKHLELNANSVKTFCVRNDITPDPSLEGVVDPTGVWCLNCCERIRLRKGSKFCSEECRRTWWKKHPGHKRRANRTRVLPCLECGASFEVYAQNQRKFCSHACYVRHRFNTRGGRK